MNEYLFAASALLQGTLVLTWEWMPREGIEHWFVLVPLAFLCVTVGLWLDYRKRTVR